MAGMLARRVRDPWWEPHDQGPRIGRGHRVIHVEHVIVCCDRETFRHPSHDFLTDLTDPATRGCLLELAREITGRPDLSAIRLTRGWGAHWLGQWAWSDPNQLPTDTAALLAACEGFERAEGRDGA